MQFYYNPQKASQAAAYLVSLQGETMDLYTLVKILYLSDRAAISDRGRSITGDSLVSLKYGPVPSEVCSALANKIALSEPWSDYFLIRSGNTIKLLKRGVATGMLSEYERDMIKATLDKFGKQSFGDLKRYTHDLPEYTDPGESSLLIDPADILRAEGWSEEEIQTVTQSHEAETTLHKVCG